MGKNRRNDEPREGLPGASAPGLDAGANRVDQDGWIRDRNVLAGLVAVAFLARLAFLLATRERDPFFSNLVMDEKVHWDWAGEILEKGHLSEAFFRPPLYYHLLAGLRALTGDSIFLCRLISSLAGVGIVVVVFGIVRRFAPRWVAVAAALVPALAVDAIYEDTRLLTDPLASFLMIAALGVALRSPARPALFGLVVGLGELARQVAIVLLPVWLFLEWIRPAEEGETARRRWGGVARRFALAVGVYLATIAPATLFNAWASKDFVRVAWNGGVNFHIGNNATSDGMTAVEWSFRKDWWGSYHDFIRAAEEAEGRKLKPSEVDDHWFGRGFAFWREQPAAALSLLGRKARLFVSGAEISNNLPITPEIATGGALFERWPVRLRGLMPFLAAGLVVLASRRFPREARAAALLAVLYSGLIVMVFVTSRYRLPVYPALAVVAGAVVAGFAGKLREPVPRALLAGFLALGAAGLAAASMPPNYPAFHVAVGNLALQQQRWDEAEAAFRRAEAMVPDFAQVQEGLGMVAEAGGRPDEAFSRYGRELEVHGSVYSRYRMAAIEYARRNFDAAAALSAPLADRFEDSALLHAQALVALERRGEAAAVLRRNVERGWAVADSEYLLALVAVLDGAPDAEERVRSHPDEERYRRLAGLLEQRRDAAPERKKGR